MPIKKDESGRRSVSVEVEVPGTTEQVWNAIATGPGISSWFVPSEVDGRVGGVATSNFGPGMESEAKITAWDPPRRFAADSKDLGPDAPTVASEWIVEARSGDTCIVRVVHSLFVDDEEWDDQLEGWESGWPSFFRILKLYLQHFVGQSSSAYQLMAMAPSPRSEAWATLTGALHLDDAGPGERVQCRLGDLSMGGWVESLGSDGDDELLLRLDEPAPGVAHLFAMDIGDRVLLSLRFYLYGEIAAEVAARDEPLWQRWIADHFPAGGTETAS
ncbi:MAG: SRPBCC domain-containing protein [Thermoanaerobaculia bacterium]|nr:SRPBCC domain-containing protein [Thermoanaerobaculia bacterium]